MSDAGGGDSPTPMTPQELAAARRKLRLGVDDEPEAEETGGGADAAPAAPADPSPTGGPAAAAAAPAPPLEPPPAPEPPPVREPVRIANCSGFYGDRLSAAQE